MGKGREATLQCSDANKKFVCVASMADGPKTGEAKVVIVSSRGGMIVLGKAVNITLPDDRSWITEFNRTGNVYKMDMRGRYTL